MHVVQAIAATAAALASTLAIHWGRRARRAAKDLTRQRESAASLAALDQYLAVTRLPRQRHPKHATR